MGWTDLGRQVGGYVCDRGADALTSALNWAGNLASLVGGILSAGSLALDESMQAGYDASMNATGLIDINITAIKLGLGMHEPFLFSQPGHSQGSFSVTLSDHLAPSYVQTIAAGLVASGCALQCVAASMDVFFQGQQDKKSHHFEYGLTLSAPGGREYAYALGAASTKALSMSLSAHAVTLSFLKFSAIGTDKYQFTHPKSSALQVETPDYSGPVSDNSFLYAREETKWWNVSIIGVHEPVLIEGKVNVSVDARYGAGVSFFSKGINEASLVPTAALGLGCYAASNLFSERHRHAMRQRFQNAEDELTAINETTRLLRSV